jgi:hypothetical protein
MSQSYTSFVNRSRDTLSDEQIVVSRAITLVIQMYLNPSKLLLRKRKT